MYDTYRLVKAICYFILSKSSQMMSRKIATECRGEARPVQRFGW